MWVFTKKMMWVFKIHIVSIIVGIHNKYYGYLQIHDAGIHNTYCEYYCGYSQQHITGIYKYTEQNF